MSTPNFRKVHARNYYVIMPTTTFIDPETDEEVEVSKDYYDYEMDIECAQECGKAKGFEPMDCTDRSYHVKGMDGAPIMRKETSVAFGKKCDKFDFNWFTFTMDVFVHNGYYSGGNYDWDIRVSTGYDEFRLSDYGDISSMVEDILDEWSDGAMCEWNAGFIAIQRRNVSKWLERMIDKFSDEADDICRSVCEEVYVCGGIFSNGEAVYYKEGSLKGKVNDVEAA